MTGWVSNEMREFTAETLNNGVIEQDPYTYCDGVTTSLLRSGVDGPHAGLADRLCNVYVRRETE